MQTWQDESDPTGQITLEKLDNGNVRFHQVIDMSNATADASEEGASLEMGMLSAVLSDQYWVVRLHTPNIVETNGEWDKETKTVEWKIPMAQLLSSNSPTELTAEFKIGSEFPWFIVGVVAAAIVVVSFIGIGIAFFIWRRRKPASAGESLSEPVQLP